MAGVGEVYSRWPPCSQTERINDIMQVVGNIALQCRQLNHRETDSTIERSWSALNQFIKPKIAKACRGPLRRPVSSAILSPI